MNKPIYGKSELPQNECVEHSGISTYSKDGVCSKCLAKKAVDKWQVGEGLFSALEPLSELLWECRNDDDST